MWIPCSRAGHSSESPRRALSAVPKRGVAGSTCRLPHGSPPRMGRLCQSGLERHTRTVAPPASPVRAVGLSRSSQRMSRRCADLSDRGRRFCAAADAGVHRPPATPVPPTAPPASQPVIHFDLNGGDGRPPITVRLVCFQIAPPIGPNPPPSFTHIVATSRAVHRIINRRKMRMPVARAGGHCLLLRRFPTMTYAWSYAARARSCRLSRSPFAIRALWRNPVLLRTQPCLATLRCLGAPGPASAHGLGMRLVSPVRAMRAGLRSAGAGLVRWRAVLAAVAVGPAAHCEVVRAT
jgi:hypothetical protein